MLFVVSALGGTPLVIGLLGALLVFGGAAWVWGTWGGLGRRTAVRRTALVVALVLGAAATTFAVGNAARPRPAPVAAQSGPWEPWSQARVDDLRARGVPVFVDFSAAWCLSCQVNERVALDTPAVQAAFRERGVATLRADWTDRSAAIADALAGFGRAGVPLYVLYAPGREPELLPEILAPGTVLGALERLPVR